tara:strand:- start:809 stop:1276 length:468 start_codon:yes stop_codon:yes gene_type:complete
MPAKTSVVIVKSKSVDNASDLNKMVVHLEQILTEKEGVEIKVRQSITEALVKGSDFVVFAGWDNSLLSSFFSTLSTIEKIESPVDKKIFLFDEPGSNCWTDLNRILTFGMDLGRVDQNLFEKIVDCWNYRDIMSYIDFKLRQLNENDSTGNTDTK